MIAEIEIDLAAARAMLARTATNADAFFSHYSAGTVPAAAKQPIAEARVSAALPVGRRGSECIRVPLVQDQELAQGVVA